MKEIISTERSQYVPFLFISLVLVGFTGILYLYDPLVFQRFFGSLNPLIAVPLVILLGFVFLSFLLSAGWFQIYKRGNLRGVLNSFIAVTLLAIAIIMIDLYFVFPEDFNVVFPQSLLYYPIMGFVAEIIFHIVPLFLLLILITSLFKNVNHDRIVWFCILIVSLFDPILQVSSGFSREYPLWINGYIGLHVFLINLIELYNFKRYDFLSMYSVRLVYYILWHIAWGFVRLGFLY